MRKNINILPNAIPACGFTKKLYGSVPPLNTIFGIPKYNGIKYRITRNIGTKMIINRIASFSISTRNVFVAKRDKTAVKPIEGVKVIHPEIRVVIRF